MTQIISVIIIAPPPKQDLGNNSSLSSSFLLDSSTNLSFAKFSSAKPKAISLGVSAYSPWDLEMAQKGYQVIEYDASIEKSPYNHPNITFVKKFVDTEDARDTISFESVIQSQNLDPNAHNVLQVDIEDSEWAILEKADLQLIAKYFPQVLFEFHNCNPCDEALSARRLQILSKINELYAPIHTHFNHHGRAFYAIMDNEYKNGLFWCDTIEVSYIRKDLLPHDAKPLSGVGLRVGLDTPNSLFFPDLPLVFRD
ncbi:hypothetical protein [uncultured Helicobacter sp.]|uniref:hypothetical protein n=1 Tax=uncultured Helicobacter sp. TaxID=175537 RepID=UPI002597C96C|nr:hypothetical protein [uncultured Helicobacter sp.]